MQNLSSSSYDSDTDIQHCIQRFEVTPNTSNKIGNVPVYLRSVKTPTPKTALTAKVHGILDEMGVGYQRLVMPTQNNLTQLKGVFEACEALVETKRAVDRVEQDIRVLKARLAKRRGEATTSQDGMDIDGDGNEVRAVSESRLQEADDEDETRVVQRQDDTQSVDNQDEPASDDGMQEGGLEQQEGEMEDGEDVIQGDEEDEEGMEDNEGDVTSEIHGGEDEDANLMDEDDGGDDVQVEGDDEDADWEDDENASETQSPREARVCPVSHKVNILTLLIETGVV
jgi:hypothetical protein